MRTHQQSRSGGKEYLQRILLLFLIGFFIGALFYYFFQNSFGDMREQLEQNLALWSREGESTASLLAGSLWRHGKYLILFGIFSMGPLKKGYQKIFTWYTGLRNGFLLMFFLCARGAFGLLLYPASLAPHALLFAPVYLTLFTAMDERRQGKRQIVKAGLILSAFIAACVLEIKVNLPLMEALL